MVKQPKVIKHKDNVAKEVVGTEAPGAVRATTPPPLDEQERVSQRIPKEVYKAGMNPKQDESDSEHSDEESSEESQSDDDRSTKTKVDENPKEIKRKAEYPKELKKKSEDNKVKGNKEYPKDTTRGSSSARRLDPQDLFKIQQQILEKIRLEKSLVDTDNHALTLAMLTQLISMTGTINQVLSAVNKVASELKIINDHEETTTRGIEKIEELVNNAWRSQGRNRASIDEYNQLVKELVKSLESNKGFKEPVSQGSKNPQDSFWMLPIFCGQFTGTPSHPFSGSQGHPMAQSSSVSQGFPTATMHAISGYQESQRHTMSQEQQRYYQQLGCRFCTGSHKPVKCTVYQTWQSRRRLLLDQQSCLYCMERGVCPNGQMHEKCMNMPLCKKCKSVYPSDVDSYQRHHNIAVCEQVKPTPVSVVKDEAQPPVKKASPPLKKESSSKMKNPKHT